jgi:xanthine dehydrogenase accessory factor
MRSTIPRRTDTAEGPKKVTSFIPRSRRPVRLDTSLELLLERGPAVPAACALATVVATAGSTYRKPGARMLIMADGSYLGLLSGGCLEADLLMHAREVIESGATRAVEYDMRGPDDILFGIGAGCEGAMRVLLEPGHHGGPAAKALAQAGAITRTGVPACLVSIHESTEFALGTYHSESLPPQLAAAADSSLAEGASREILSDRGSQRLRAFVQYLAPPPHVLLCGAGPDAQPVAAAARALGWRVSVVDHRPAYADARRFAGAHVVLADPGSLARAIDLARCHAVVVMSHHLNSDVAYLRAVCETGAPIFVGLLGPAARRQRILHELGPAGDVLRERLRGPVGIDVGAVTPEGIALAIVAEVHAWLAGRSVVAPVQLEDAEGFPAYE